MPGLGFTVLQSVSVQSVAKVYEPMLLQSEPYSARGLLFSSARCTARHSVAKPVRPHCYKSVCAYVHVAVGAVQCPGPLLPGGLRLRDGSHLGHTRIQGTVRNIEDPKKGLMIDAM